MFIKHLVLLVFISVFCDATAQTFDDLQDHIYDSELRKVSLTKDYKVVDFWFLKCAPCIYTIPHLNDLAASFKDEADFISVTFSPKSEVESFLRNNEFLPFIIFDSSEHIIQRFEVRSYPFVFVLDKNDSVLFSGHPSSLNRKLLAKIIDTDHKPEGLDTNMIKSGPEKQARGVFTLKVNQYSGRFSKGISRHGGNLAIINHNLTEILSILGNVSEYQISTEDTARYDLYYKLEQQQPDMEYLVLSELLDSLDMSLSVKSRTFHGYVISLDNLCNTSQDLNFQTVHETSYAEDSDKIHFVNFPVDQLEIKLENIFGIPIEIKGSAECKITFAGSKKSINDFLEEFRRKEDIEFSFSTFSKDWIEVVKN